MMRPIWIIVLLLLAFAAREACAGTPLAAAVKNRNTHAVRALLRQHVDVNAAEPDGSTALYWAALQDDLEMVRLLIQAGADVSAANRYGVAPLSLACINGNAAVIEALVQAGAPASPPPFRSCSTIAPT